MRFYKNRLVSSAGYSQPMPRISLTYSGYNSVYIGELVKMDTTSEAANNAEALRRTTTKDERGRHSAEYNRPREAGMPGKGAHRRMGGTATNSLMASGYS